MHNNFFLAISEFFEQINQLRESEIENLKKDSDKKLRIIDTTILASIYKIENNKESKENIYKEVVKNIGEKKRSTVSQSISRLKSCGYLTKKSFKGKKQPNIELTNEGKQLGYKLCKIDELIIIKSLASKESEDIKYIDEADKWVTPLLRRATIRLTKCRKKENIDIFRVCMVSEEKECLHIARFYDYLLGGQFYFPFEKQIADKVIEYIPNIRSSVLQNREFTSRAIKFLIRQGISQFIDIGSGLVTFGNTHEIIEESTGDYKLLYVDSDPYVVNSLKYMLPDDSKKIQAIEAKLEDTGTILEEAKKMGMVMSKPIAIIATAVIHFIEDFEQAKKSIKQLRDKVAVGSFFAISHLAKQEELTLDEQKNREQGLQIYRSLVAPVFFREKGDIQSIFTTANLTLLPQQKNAEPEIVYATMWRPDIKDKSLFAPTDKIKINRIFVGIGKKENG